jgi:hypothetical protein
MPDAVASRIVKSIGGESYDREWSGRAAKGLW